LIYVGKKGGDHTLKQEEINALILEKASKGLRVARLKGGDPFIFGRGGEEAQELVEAGIPFEVIPGVTSAIAVPAYAGIPLTHRDHTSTVAFITGHEDPAKEKSAVPWDRIATGPGTLVFLMGVGNLPKIAEALIANGRAGDTPVAVIERGTGAAQRTVTGSLQDIAEKVEQEGVRPPAVIVVGEVVGLRHSLNWFERRPLFGKRIVVTRAREQASGFKAGLEKLGAECLEFPTISVVPPENWAALDRALKRLERYQWIIFTSVNGVKYFFDRLTALGWDARELSDSRIAAIGPKTAKALLNRGIQPDLVPDEYRAEAIVEAMKEYKVHGQQILLPRASIAREALPVALVDMGAFVDEVPAYRTVKPDHDKAPVKALLESGKIHMVTFTSSSTVTNFMDMFRLEKNELKAWMKAVTVACIGPITAKTAEENGLSVAVIPDEYTIEALTRAILSHFS
jgi:uroporphyrinogen III methyltransferase/synthase